MDGSFDWGQIFEVVWSDFLGALGWVGQLFSGASQVSEAGDQYDIGDDDSVAYVPYTVSSTSDGNVLIDFTGGTTADLFTGGATADSFTGGWTIDFFTAGGNAGPNLGNGDFTNPFVDPSPADPSDLWADNSTNNDGSNPHYTNGTAVPDWMPVFPSQTYSEQSGPLLGASPLPLPPIPPPQPGWWQTVFPAAPSTANLPTQTPSPTVSNWSFTPDQSFGSNQSFGPDEADALAQSGLPARFVDPPAFPPIDTWPAAPLSNPQSAPPAFSNDIVLSSSPFSLDADPSSGLSQPNVFAQILSGTYGESVLQQQLTNQGRLPGVFVSPVIPFDSLFNPNATSLAGATLLASHSPNEDLRAAQQLELAASLTPFIGSIATWMNPRSGAFAKGLATVGFFASAFSLASAFSSTAGEIGNLGGELGSEGSAFEGPPATSGGNLFGPFSHQINQGGLSDIIANQRLISTAARSAAGGAEAVRAGVGEAGFLPDATDIEFFTEVKPSLRLGYDWSTREFTPYQADWPMPEGEYLDIRLQRIFNPDGTIDIFGFDTP